MVHFHCLLHVNFVGAESEISALPIKICMFQAQPGAKHEIEFIGMDLYLFCQDCHNGQFLRTRKQSVLKHLILLFQWYFKSTSFIFKGIVLHLFLYMPVFPIKMPILLPKSSMQRHVSRDGYLILIIHILGHFLVFFIVWIVRGLFHVQSRQ